MNMSSIFSKDFTDLIVEMKSRGDAFAVATVVRTVSVTAAKPGAKAIINQSGEVVEGWIGGGCARHAVLKAALQSIADGETRLVAIRPEELIQDQESVAELSGSVVVARNMCPSKGSMEIFVEPMLSNPALLIIGGSPVAQTLAAMAAAFDLNVALYSDNMACVNHQRPYRVYENGHEIALEHPHRYIIVATQGSGDLRALELALSLNSRHVAFVGSGRKIAHLREKMIAGGADSSNVERIHSPAGMDIGAVTPQEIALSILAEVIKIRRSHINNRMSTA